MARSLGSLTVDLLLKTGSFISDMGRASRVTEREAKEMSRNIDKAAKSIRSAFATIGAAVGVASLGAFVKQTLQSAEAAGEAAKKISITTQSFTALAYAADRSNVSQTALQVGFRTLNKTLADASSGGKFSKVFETLKIDIEDAAGKTKKADVVFKELAEKFRSFSDGPEKAALAMRLFGKAGTELLPLLNEGADGIAKLEERAKLLGQVITDETAKAADDFNDSLKDLATIGTGLGQIMLSKLAVPLSELTDEFRDSAVQGAGLESLAEDLIGVFIKLAEVLVHVRAGLKRTFLAGAEALDIATQVATIGVVRDRVDTQGETALILKQERDAIAALDRFRGQVNARAQTLISPEASRAFAESADKFVGPPIEAIKKKVKELPTLAPSIALGLTKPMNEAADAAKDAALALLINGDTAAAAAEKARKANEKAAAEAKRLSEQLAKERKKERDAEDAYRRKELTAAEDAMDEARASLDLIIKSEQRRAEIAGLSGEEQRKRLAFYEREDEIARSLAGLTEEQKKELGLVNAAKLAGLKIDERQTEEAKEQLRLARESARGLFGAAGSGTASDPFVGLNSLGEVLTNSIVQGFKFGVAGFKNSWRQFIEDFAALSGTEKTQVVAQSITSIANFAAEFNALRGSMGTFDAALNTAVNAAAQMPGVVGDIARAVQAVDALFGGRLLGTKFETERTGRSFAIGAGGVTGSTFETQSRQRSFFRGTQRRTSTSALDPQTRESLEEFLRGMQAAVAQAARALGATAPALIAGSFAETFDKDGKLLTQIGTIAGRTFRESAENFQRRLTAENLIAVVGTLDDTASMIADRWRADARELLDGAQLLLSAQGAIKSGNGLLGPGGTLAATVDLIEDLAYAGEPLAQAFARVQSATQIYTEALDVLGVDLDISREALVTMAAQFAEFAGGVEAAATKLQKFFEYFYSPEELAEGALQRTGQARADGLTGLGLSSSTTDAQFRAFFEQQFVGASAEYQAQLLAVGVTLSEAGRAQRAYNDLLRKTADELANLSRDIDAQLDAIDGLSLSEQLGIIAREMDDTVAAARLLGATELQLGRIRLLAARQAAAAIAATERSAADLIARLYGGTNNVAGGLQTVANGIDAVGAAIGNFRDEMLLDGNLSPLGIQEQFDEALRQAYATGDDGIKRRALELARQLHGSGDDYNALFNQITAIPTRVQGNAGDNLGGGLSEDEIGATAAARLRDAQSLADLVAQLATAQDRTFADIATQLGLDLSSLAADLGLEDLEALNTYLTSLAQPTSLTPTPAEASMILYLQEIADILAGRQVISQALGAGGGKPTPRITSYNGPHDGPFDPVTGDPIGGPTNPNPGVPTPGPPPSPNPPELPPNDPLVAGFKSLEERVGAVEIATQQSGGATVGAIVSTTAAIEGLRRELRGREVPA